jgi:hypothetical protein
MRAFRRSSAGGASALALAVAFVGAVGVAVLTSLARSAAETADRDRRTVEAMAIAKQALIGFAIRGTKSTQGRPGDLPCPDLNNDGSADAVPGCSSAASRIGRLPWRTLGLPDLRDGHGERLWYAVSVNFKDNPRTACTAPGSSSCLNSDTPGTITVRDASGALLHDGSQPARGLSHVPTGAVAVVISPGPVLARLGAPAAQDRSCARGDGIDQECIRQDGKCTGTTPAAYAMTARCNPANYLDLAGTSALSRSGSYGSPEDNVTFTDGSSADGFISGDVFDSAAPARRLAVNDRVLPVSYADLLPALEMRVANEVLKCLLQYARANGGKYPFAARPDNLADFSDQYGARFGRLPDQRFMQTRAIDPSMSDAWTDDCGIKLRQTGAAAPANVAWWANWKDSVFFAFAGNLAPNALVAAWNCDPLSTCFTVDPPSSARDKNVVVVVAGRTLAGRTRATPASPVAVLANYLEDANATLGPVFKRAPATDFFNDKVVFQ